MYNTQLLSWDSDILGISVAKIIAARLNQADLYNSLQKLKEKGVVLVYWCIDSHDNPSKQAAMACNAFLADKKITYIQGLTTHGPLPFPYQDVEIYLSDKANVELENMAIEISQLSRFSQDPKLTAAQAIKLYKNWIHNACQKIMAKTVLVVKKNHRFVGMVTINEKQGRADLSLLGVAPANQGQGIGKRLVCAAIAWCIKQHYATCQVVTQKTNFKARRLYESCGFNEEKIEYFYHFWL